MVLPLNQERNVNLTAFLYGASNTELFVFAVDVALIMIKAMVNSLFKIGFILGCFYCPLNSIK